MKVLILPLLVLLYGCVANNVAYSETSVCFASQIPASHYAAFARPNSIKCKSGDFQQEHIIRPFGTKSMVNGCSTKIPVNWKVTVDYGESKSCGCKVMKSHRTRECLQYHRSVKMVKLYDIEDDKSRCTIHIDSSESLEDYKDIARAESCSLEKMDSDEFENLFLAWDDKDAAFSSPRPGVHCKLISEKTISKASMVACGTNDGGLPITGIFRRLKLLCKDDRTNKRWSKNQDIFVRCDQG